MRLISKAAIAAAIIGAAPASAVTLTFEDGIAGAPVVSTGAVFTGAFYFQCDGGCPAPATGLFVSGANVTNPFTVTFASLQTLVSFINVSFSDVTAQAFTAGGTLVDSVSSIEDFPISGTTLELSGADISYVTFSGPQYGIDNLTFDAGAAVPEPASWALMIGGVGVAGAAMRRRRAVRANVSFA